jgi:hypothetical protein
MLPLGGRHVKHAVQHGIWVPTQHLLWDQGKHGKFDRVGWSKDFPDADKLVWFQCTSEYNTALLTEHMILNFNKNNFTAAVFLDIEIALEKA